MRFATPREDRGKWDVREDPIEESAYSTELQNLLDAETVEEEDMVYDETLSEGEDRQPSMIARVDAEITAADVEVPAMRNRVLRHDGAHEAAEAGEPDQPGQDYPPKSAFCHSKGK